MCIASVNSLIHGLALVHLRKTLDPCRPGRKEQVPKPAGLDPCACMENKNDILFAINLQLGVKHLTQREHYVDINY